MSPTIRVFLDEHPIDARPGIRARDMVSRHDAALAAALDAGTAFLTDGVGRPIDPATPLTAGAIIRVVRSARRSTEPGTPA